MNEKNFLKNYFDKQKKLITFNKAELNKLLRTKKILKNLKKTNNKILIFGNGGSAAIASHFSVDITKNAGVRCTNFNESDLITCFSNDYGYHKWVEKAVEYYGDKGDVLIVISASGNSHNMINGCNLAKKKKNLNR